MVTKLVELARLHNSRVKGNHVFRSSSRTGDTFVCEREYTNRYSAVAILVKRRRQDIGHVPERLAGILAPMLEDVG